MVYVLDRSDFGGYQNAGAPWTYPAVGAMFTSRMHNELPDDPQRDVGARAAQLLRELGAQDRDHDCSSGATPSRSSPRNASSSRFRAMTVSTATPSRTSAATSSARG